MNREQRRAYVRAFGREPQCRVCGSTSGPDLLDVSLDVHTLGAVECEACCAAR